MKEMLMKIPNPSLFGICLFCDTIIISITNILLGYFLYSLYSRRI